MILVKKKDGSTRFVIDYHRLNNVTVTCLCPMPNVKNILDKTRGCKYFSSMDMASLYRAVSIKEEDRNKTAFKTL